MQLVLFPTPSQHTPHTPHPQPSQSPPPETMVNIVNISAAILSVSYCSSAGAGIANILEKCLKKWAVCSGRTEKLSSCYKRYEDCPVLLTEINIKHQVSLPRKRPVLFLFFWGGVGWVGRCVEKKKTNKILCIFLTSFSVLLSRRSIHFSTIQHSSCYLEVFCGKR